MKKEVIEPERHYKILEYVMATLMNKGMKATTMDYIASSLQISKRTLYEIYVSKEELFKQALSYFHNKMADELKKIFLQSSNVMEAIIKCFLYNRDLMSNVNADFIKDMEEFSNKENLISESRSSHHHLMLYDVLLRGVKEGYFREDANLKVQCRMLTIQMASLKHTEELFPKDITLLDVYDSIIYSFLRGLSTRKGLDELEKYIPS